MAPLKTALLAQIIGGFVAAAAIQLLYPKLLVLPVWSLAQGGSAAMVSYKLGASRWWIPIHLGFLPLAAAAMRLGVPPSIWLAGFILLLLLFWRTDKSQVPLYLSNFRTACAVSELLPQGSCRFIDLGCGTGSLLQHLAKSRPDSTFVGMEHAPLPFLLAWLRSRRIPNMIIRYGDFWQEKLSTYQCVYAFLSPVPMTRLWQKMCAETQPGSQLISNSFEIPGVTPSQTVNVHDRRRTRLFCYLQSPGK